MRDYKGKSETLKSRKNQNPKPNELHSFNQGLEGNS